MQRAKGDFAMIFGSDDRRAGRDQIEIAAIPEIDLDYPPATD
ncbi:hypothetical protein ACK6D9_22045 [Hoeflea sp. Naph1]